MYAYVLNKIVIVNDRLLLFYAIIKSQEASWTGQTGDKGRQSNCNVLVERERKDKTTLACNDEERKGNSPENKVKWKTESRLDGSQQSKK